MAGVGLSQRLQTAQIGTCKSQALSWVVFFKVPQFGALTAVKRQKKSSLLSLNFLLLVAFALHLWTRLHAWIGVFPLIPRVCLPCNAEDLERTLAGMVLAWKPDREAFHQQAIALLEAAGEESMQKASCFLNRAPVLPFPGDL